MWNRPIQVLVSNLMSHASGELDVESAYPGSGQNVYLRSSFHSYPPPFFCVVGSGPRCQGGCVVTWKPKGILVSKLANKDFLVAKIGSLARP